MIQQNIFADGMTSIASDGEALKTTYSHVPKNDFSVPDYSSKEQAKYYRNSVLREKTMT